MGGSDGKERRAFRVFRFRKDAARELDEELAFHFEMTWAALEREGMSPEAARREAERRFGNERVYRRAMRKLDEGRWRMTAGREVLDRMWFTVTGAARRIRRGPGFALAVIVTLALGMGANAVMFGIVDRLLLSPPQHVVDAEEVRKVYSSRTGGDGQPFTSDYLTFPDYEDLLTVEGYAQAAAYTAPQPVRIGRGEESTEVRVSLATASLFPLVGAPPVAGRFYTAEEDITDGPRVAVISEEFWARRYGSDPSAVGSLLEFGAGRYEIVGVAPAGFTGVELRPVDLWVPIRVAAVDAGSETCLPSRNCWWIQTAVRLAPGASEEVAADQASALHVSTRAERVEGGQFDADARVLTGSIIAGNAPVESAETSVSRWLAGVSLIVLLIACANVANLLLGRGVRLRQELAVRVSLGANRGRLLGDLLTEALILAAMGSAVAWVIAVFGSGFVHQFLLPGIAFSDQGLGLRLLLFLGIATVVTALLAGFLPAWQASRSVGERTARTGRGQTSRRSKTQAALMLAQGVFSVVLLVGAGLFVRSFRAALDLDLGFDYRPVIVTEIQFDPGLDGTTRAGIYDDALERVRALPGITEAALTVTIPLWSSISYGRPGVTGLAEYERPPGGGPYVNKVGSGYFETMGLAILEGRAIEAGDDDETAPPVTVVSSAMASIISPNESAIGKCLFIGEDAPCTTIVGVVEDHRRDGLVEEQANHLYFVNIPHPEIQGPPQGMMTKVAGDPSAMVQQLREAIHQTSAQIQFANARPLENLVAPHMRSWKLGATMFGVFGILALVVAGVGLYSILSFDVAQRTREMGIRSALGATRDSILGLVVRAAVSLTAGGLILGLVVARVGSRWVEPLLFSVPASDPWTYGLVAATLLGVATLAALLPGLRATRVDPAVALRSD